MDWIQEDITQHFNEQNESIGAKQEITRASIWPFIMLGNSIAFKEAKWSTLFQNIYCWKYFRIQRQRLQKVSSKRNSNQSAFSRYDGVDHMIVYKVNLSVDFARKKYSFAVKNVIFHCILRYASRITFAIKKYCIIENKQYFLNFTQQFISLPSF